jgi:hypothetical protein
MKRKELSRNRHRKCASNLSFVACRSGPRKQKTGEECVKGAVADVDIKHRGFWKKKRTPNVEL